MPQSLSYKGYRVSGEATEFQGKWSATYEIQKQSQPVRRCNFVVSGSSVAVAENAALLRGVEEVDEMVEDFY